MRPIVGAVIGAVVSSLAACAPGPFHSAFESGQYERAVEHVRADSALLRDERTLYRLGLVYATPGTPHHEPERARAVFERLLDRHPDGEHRSEARRMLALLEELRTLNGRVRELRTQIEQLKAVDLEENPPDSAGRRRR